MVSRFGVLSWRAATALDFKGSNGEIDVLAG